MLRVYFKHDRKMIGKLCELAHAGVLLYMRQALGKETAVEEVPVFNSHTTIIQPTTHTKPVSSCNPTIASRLRWILSNCTFRSRRPPVPTQSGHPPTEQNLNGQNITQVAVMPQFFRLPFA
jgi:hypothetical protein